MPVGTVTLNASNASLTGDVLASAGVADLRLERGSVLTGAVRQFDAGRINSLSIDNTSAWHVRGDSRLESLNNDGLVAFDAPAAPLTMPSSPAALSASNGFKTLTVTHYAGSGTLVLNTRLGDDSSPTDRLVIDGGAATGNTGLRIVNAGGSGARTNIGIRVVETVNGGSPRPARSGWIPVRPAIAPALAPWRPTATNTACGAAATAAWPTTGI